MEIKIDGLYKYATGAFLTYDSAAQYRKKLESIFPDAFVIAVKDNKILPLQQVLENNRLK